MNLIAFELYLQMSLHDRQGYLDVHIIKARNLSPKLTSKLEPGKI